MDEASSQTYIGADSSQLVLDGKLLFNHKQRAENIGSFERAILAFLVYLRFRQFFKTSSSKRALRADARLL